MSNREKVISFLAPYMQDTNPISFILFHTNKYSLLFLLFLIVPFYFILFLVGSGVASHWLNYDHFLALCPLHSQ